MRHELASNRLRVRLVPDIFNEARLRQAVDHNPEWYRQFCADHAPSKRSRPRQRKKPDTFIKRAHTLRALDELARGKCETLYAKRLLPYVQQVDKACRAGTYRIGG